MPGVLKDSLHNRGMAFSDEDRRRLGLVRRLPSGYLQAARTYKQVERLPDSLHNVLDPWADRVDDTRVQAIDRSGHFLPEEAPDQILAQLHEFLPAERAPAGSARSRSTPP